ncbi:hypothetical protein ABZ815_52665 [Nonomuraea sp. NPDC047529]|uniref:hypothetical protein n=1 Tax=Nonomuraea sp. NPDC047529 TaxID=3155623 RepID=UPI00340F5160
MNNARLRSLSMPEEGPDDKPSQDPRFHLGMLSVLTTTFVALVGQGHDPSHALAMSIVVCVGGHEIIRRLPQHHDDGRGGPRWA